MGYQSSLEANGIVIKEFKEFGDYQGNWFAVTEDGNVISGSYGSCSGCDAFQAEIDYGSGGSSESNGKYYDGNYNECSKEEYERLQIDYNERLKKFGQSYIDSAETIEEIIKRYEIKCAEEYAWEDDKEVLEWLKTLA